MSLEVKIKKKLKEFTLESELHVETGCTGLMGPSGSGKSTISKLIARFWDIQKGKITIGGKDIKAMEPESLMSYMSFVFQDVTLFNDTVMNNIRIGNPNATDEQVITAAQAAYCDEFVREIEKEVLYLRKVSR